MFLFSLRTLRKPLCTLRLMDLGFMLNYPLNYDKFAPESINPEHRWLFNVELLE